MPNLKFLFTISIIIGSLHSSYQALAQTVYWTGNVDNSWVNPLNWSTNTVPNAAQEVVIQNTPVPPNMPVLTTTTTIERLVIGVGVTCTIGAGANLTVDQNLLNSGSFIVNGGVVNVGNNMNSDGTVDYLSGASFVVANDLTNGGTFNITGGNITVQRDFINLASFTTTIAAGRRLIVRRNFVNDGIITASAAGATLEFTGGGASQLNSNTALTLHTLLLSKSGSTNVTLNPTTGTAVVINSDLTIPNNIGLILADIGGLSLTVNGNVSVTGSITLNRGMTINGNLAVNAGATHTMAANGSLAINNGNLTNAGTFSGNRPTTFGGTTTDNSAGGTGTTTFGAITVNKSGRAFTFNRPVSATSFTNTAGNTSFANTANIGGNAVVTAGNVDFNNTCTITGEFTANGGTTNFTNTTTCSGAFAINGTSIVNLPAANVSVGGNFSRAGTATMNVATGNRVIFTGNSASITGANLTFHDLEINKSAAGNTMSLPNSGTLTITINNQLILTRGIFNITGNLVTPSPYTTNRMIVLEMNATYSQPTPANSFVAIPFRKRFTAGFTGNYVFPTGHNGKLGRLALINLTAGNDNDAFTVEYFFRNFGNNTLDAGLPDVSDKEYWRLVRETGNTRQANVRLYWESSVGSGFNAVNHTTPPFTAITVGDMRVAQWVDPSQRWFNRNGTGTLLSGTVVNGVGYVESPTMNTEMSAAANFWSIGANLNNRDWATLLWLGGAAGDPNNWHNPANWQPNGVPDGTQEAYITGDRPQCNVFQADAIARNVVIDWLLDPTSPATVRNTLTIANNRTLRISSATANAQSGFLTNYGYVVNNGTLLVTNSVRNRGTFNTGVEAQITNNDTMRLASNFGDVINAENFDEGNVGSSNAIITNNAYLTVGNSLFNPVINTPTRVTNLVNTRNGRINNANNSIFIVTQDFTNQNLAGTSVVVNDGTFTVVRDMTNDRTFTNNDSLMIRRNHNNNSIFNGTGSMYVYGDQATTLGGNTAYTHNLFVLKTSLLNINFNNTGGITVSNDFTSTANGTLTFSRPVTFWRNVNSVNTTTSTTNSTVTLGGNVSNSEVSGVFSGGSNGLHNLTINKTGVGLQGILNTPVIVANDVTVTAGELVVTGTNTLSVGRNFAQNAIFTPNNSTVRLYGTSNATVSGTGTLSFHNLAIDKTNGGTIETVTLSRAFNVTNQLSFPGEGIVVSSGANVMTLTNTATSTGQKARAFVSGRVIKQLDAGQSFTFPIGKLISGTPIWAPAGLENVSTASTFEAEYFNRLNTVTPGATNLAGGLRWVSRVEHWIINRNAGTGSADVALYWKDALNSDIFDITTGASQDLFACRYNGTQWERIVPSNIDPGSSVGSGGEGIVRGMTVGSFSPFTFGSLTGSNPLPLSLLSFNAKLINGKVQLEWSIANEQNIQKYYVERSADGKTFETITEINALNKTNNIQLYTALDANFGLGANYYRLRQVSQEGEINLSEIIDIIVGAGDMADSELRVFPNPVVGSTCEVLLPRSMRSASYQVMLTSLDGQKLWEEEIKNTQNKLQINLPASLSQGVYLLKISDEALNVSVKLVKK